MGQRIRLFTTGWRAQFTFTRPVVRIATGFKPCTGCGCCSSSSSKQPALPDPETNARRLSSTFPGRGRPVVHPGGQMDFHDRFAELIRSGTRFGDEIVRQIASSPGEATLQKSARTLMQIQ